MSTEFPIERVVTALSPLFAAAASFITGFIDQHTGLNLGSTGVAVVEGLAFLGTMWVVTKWLQGRQIPEIAGLHITPQQIDELHSEIDTYLAQHAQQDIAQVVNTVIGMLPKPPATPTKDEIATEVLERFRKSLAVAPAAGAAPA